VSGRSRLAFLFAAIVFATAAHAVTARSASIERFGDQHDHALVTFTHHEESAVVPLNQVARDGRALAKVLSVPLAGVSALAALLALWCAASGRRRRRPTLALVTYRRRGPPALPSVD
jgi:hypothetical protein